LFRWNLHGNGMFSVKSMYQTLVHVDEPINNKKIWKMKLPLILRERSWHESMWCCFCYEDETIKHLFFLNVNSPMQLG
jgi:hypothetical protein